jgi:RimJ/RimL family protein N-acetyltransferase
MPTPAYRILTPRLELRCWQPADAAEVLAVIEDSVAHLAPWMPWIAQRAQTVAEQAQILRRFRAAFDRDEDYVYGIFARDEDGGRGAVVGGTGLHPRVGPRAAEIGYWIRHDRTGAGLATEAAAALTQVGFRVHALARLDIQCDPDNRASARVIGKLGYRHEATLRQRFPMPDRLRDTMMWTMLPEELPASAAAAIPVEAFDLLGQRLL